MNCDILIYAEDPGAANYVSDLPKALAAGGLRAVLLARAGAADLLRRRGAAYESLADHQSAAAVLEAYRPRVIAVGTAEKPENLGLSLIATAPVFGAASVGIVDHRAHADYRFRGLSHSPLAFAPDVILVPDKESREDFVRLGHPRDRVISCGHPLYDRVREERSELERTGVEPLRAKWFTDAGSRTVVLFLSELSDGMNHAAFQRSDAYTLVGRGDTVARTAIVLEEVLDAIASLNPRPYVALRLHPKEAADAYAPYSDEIDAVIGADRSLESVFAADVIVGLTTTLLVEATILGKRTLSVVPRAEERNWLPGTGAGPIALADDRTVLRRQLSRLAAADEPISQDSIERCYPSGATNRVCQVLRAMVATSELKPHGDVPRY
jgi:hypothetical protein